MVPREVDYVAEDPVKEIIEEKKKPYRHKERKQDDKPPEKRGTQLLHHKEIISTELTIVKDSGSVIKYHVLRR